MRAGRGCCPRRRRNRETKLPGLEYRSSRIWPVHESNLSRDLAPLQLSLGSAYVSCRPGGFPPAQELLPLEQLVGKSQVRLDDDVQPSRAHEAVGSREGHVILPHDFGDANGSAPGNADSAVHQGGCAVAPTAICSEMEDVSMRLEGQKRAPCTRKSTSPLGS